MFPVWKLLTSSGIKDFLTLSQLGKYFELIKEQRNCVICRVGGRMRRTLVYDEQWGIESVKEPATHAKLFTNDKIVRD